MHKTLHDADVEGKRVLVRGDLDVPADETGRITDDTRLRTLIPTIMFLVERHAKVVLMGHRGRPGGKTDLSLSMAHVAGRLSEILGTEVRALDDCTGPIVRDRIGRMRPGDVVVLENLRFNPGEETNDARFAQEIAKDGDLYVNDAYANCHRDHASMTGITRFLPACAGLALEKELAVMRRVTERPEKPYIAIIGGVKGDKIGVIDTLITKVDYLIVSGVLANTFLKAAGKGIGGSKFDKETVGEAKRLLAVHGDRIVLPIDVRAAASYDKDARYLDCDLGSIPEGYLILDIGPKTIMYYESLLAEAKTVVWGGPLGVFEWESFARGTREVMAFITTTGAFTLVGGGDSGAAVRKFGLEGKMSHVSTGGGVTLQMLEGKPLPAVAALETAAKTG
ncbi:phosphoglycerate kinase [Candidatus Woesearchaeota archaeon]|nr:phosphoglycerate kinase [Candidatus Woesearchaeota archaeon]